MQKYFIYPRKFSYFEPVTNTYRAAKTRRKICDDTPEFPTIKGVRQGVVISLINYGDISQALDSNTGKYIDLIDSKF